MLGYGLTGLTQPTHHVGLFYIKVIFWIGIRLAENNNATQAVRLVTLIRPADTFSRKREKVCVCVGGGHSGSL